MLQPAPNTQPAPRARNRPMPPPAAPTPAAEEPQAERAEIEAPEGMRVEETEGGYIITHLATRYRAFHPCSSRFTVQTVAANLKRSLDKVKPRGAGLPSYQERPMGWMPEGWRWDERVRVIETERPEARCTRRGKHR